MRSHFVPGRVVRGLIAPLAAVAVALLLAAAGASTALAAGPTLTVRSAPGQDGAILLTATAAGPAGTTINGLDVTFGLRVEFMGSTRTISLGTATTDSSGQAALRYVPTTDGDQEIVASLSDGSGAASEPVTVHVTGATPALQDQAPSLAGVAGVIFPLTVLVVLAVWALLVGAFLYAVLGIARPRVRASWPQPQVGTRHAGQDLGEP